MQRVIAWRWMLSAIVAVVGSLAVQSCETPTEPPTLRSLSVLPPQLTLVVGESQLLVATGTMSDGGPATLTGISWSTGAPGTATVSSSGMVTAAGVGTTNVFVGAGGLQASAQVTVVPPPPPAAPLQVNATNVTSTGFTLGWLDASSNELGFRIESCVGSGCTNFAAIASTSANISTAAISGLSPATTYRVRVIAFNGGGDSPASVPHTVTTADVAPAAPTAVTATSLGPTSVRIGWVDNSANESAFRVDRCAGTGCADLAPVVTLPANVTEWIDAGLEPAQEYRYAVYAVNAAGASAATAIVTVVTPGLPPVAPMGLAADRVLSDRISLTWTDASDDEDDFVVERCTGTSCTDFVTVAVLAAGATSFEDSGLSALTTYRYRVRARNEGGQSPSSAVVSVTTTDVPPDAPTNVAVSEVSAVAARVTWTASGSNHESFVLESCAGSGCTDATRADTLSSATTEAQLIGLAPATTYRVWVRALNAGGSSPASVTVAFVTLDVTPLAPSGLIATAVNATGVTLTWLDNSGNEAGFIIDRCAGDLCDDFVDVDTVAAGIVDYEVTDLTPATAYRFRVRAFNAIGASEVSAPLAVVTRDVPPAAPGDVAVVGATASSLTLAWTDNSTNETGFRISRCSGTGCTAFDSLAFVAAGVTTYLDAGLPEATVFRYRVEAVNAAGASAADQVAEGVTQLTPPAAPTQLAVIQRGGTSLTLQWTDNATNEDAQDVERCGGAGCADYAVIATLGANVTEFVDTGLDTGSVYGYRVRSHNAEGASEYSASTEAVTLRTPLEPTGLQALDVTATTLRLSWNGADQDAAEYRVEACAGTDCETFALVATVSAPATGALIGSLDPATVYRWRVIAANELGSSVPSAVVNATTLDVPPAAPTALQVGDVLANSLTLSWSDASSNESGFRVESCAGSDCSAFEVIASVPADSTVLLVGNLLPITPYRFRVRAFNALGESAPTEAVGVTTANAAPLAPSGLRLVEATATTIALAWDDNSNNETEFRVERCIDAECTDFTVRTTLAADVTTFVDSAVAPRTTYRYRVVAGNGEGDSPVSAPLDVSTPDLPPSAPSDVAVSDISAATAQVSWVDNSVNEAGFRVETCVGIDCTDFAEVANVGPDTTVAVLTGLSPITPYRVRVFAVNAAGTSVPSGFVAFTTLDAPPAAPEGVSVASFDAATVTLTWTDASNNETGFTVERCSGAGCTSFAEVGSVGTGITTFEDASVAPATAYRYRVFARNDIGVSVASDPVDVTTLDVPPSSPTGLQATGATATSITLGWTDNSGNETTFRVERCTGDLCTDFTTVATLGANVTTYADAGLASLTTYRYRVSAENAVGASAPAGPLAATTLDSPPNAPGALTVTSTTASTASLTWIDNSANETGFRVEQCVGGGCTSFTPATLLPANASSTTVSNLSPVTTYRFRVIAFNGTGDSPVGGPVTATTLDVPPSAPTSLAVSATTAASITLTWADNSANESGFQVERCAGTGCSGFTLVHTTGASTATWTDNSLSPASAYRYRVRAVNAAGNSSYTSAVEGVTQALPAAPTNLAGVSQSISSIQLSWWDNASNETGYQLQRCTGQGCSNYTAYATPGANASSYTVNSLTEGQYYGFRVRAVSDGGTSAWSNTISVRVQYRPTIATGLSAAANGTTSIILNWSDNSDNESGFRIERCAGSASCTNYATLTTVSPNATSYTDQGLTPSTTYRYRVVAENAYGSVGPSNSASATTNTPAVTPSPSVALSVASNSRIDLSWADVQYESGYQVQRCQGAGCSNFSFVTELPAGSTSYSNTGLQAGTTYTYRVVAFNAVSTAPSNTPNATTYSAFFACGTTSTLGGSAIGTDARTVTTSDCAANGYYWRLYSGTGTQPAPVAVIRTTTALSHRVLNVKTGATVTNSYIPAGWDLNGLALSAGALAGDNRLAFGGNNGSSWRMAYARCGYIPRIDDVSQSVSVPSNCTYASNSTEMHGLIVLGPSWDTLLDDIRITLSSLAGVPTQLCLIKYPIATTSSSKCADKGLGSLSTTLTLDVNLNDWGTVDDIYAIRIRTSGVQLTNFSTTVRRLTP